ncbi:hypothetical protein HYPGJ_10436 [Hyphomicrobium sp. GJ21]|nr:hypothetical protein HYPGJ_10436 [Hyphomicrobium sp. GJ21]
MVVRRGYHALTRKAILLKVKRAIVPRIPANSTDQPSMSGSQRIDQ